mmetsp:Transcript_24534/g.70502  ORF Transcript_24534/g.70502 Transcript_24534/m.70502 type:complete len:269 (-) Transcript_24534:132-938(-)
MPVEAASQKYATVGSASPATTQKWLPQTASPGSRADNAGEAESDPELEHTGSKASFHMPSGKATRKMAGKAGKAATKGATKMASALKKGLRRAQAPGEGASKGSSLTVATEDAAGLIHAADTLDSDLHEGDPKEEEEAPHDPRSCSVPSKQARASRQVQKHERSALMGVSGPPVQAGPSCGKASKACRALQLDSIWDIPTSRFPQPIPEPLDRPNDVQAHVVGARQTPLPPVAVSAKAVGKAKVKTASRHKSCCARCVKVVLRCFFSH